MRRVFTVTDTVIRVMFAFPFAMLAAIARVISKISGRIANEIIGDKW